MKKLIITIMLLATIKATAQDKRGLIPERRSSKIDSLVRGKGKYNSHLTIIGAFPHSTYIWNDTMYVFNDERDTMQSPFKIYFEGKIKIIVPSQKIWYENGDEIFNYSPLKGATIDTTYQNQH